jgi:pyruvate formate lyase activating enzyme
VQCDLCPRACHLKDGQRGFCYIRRAEEHAVVLDSYGRASGFCIDPIEKKPLNHFYPGSSVLSFGTAGCNLGCRFCQNWDISKARKDDRLQDMAAPSDIVAAAQRAGCRSIAYTYNDPVIFAEFAIDCAALAREAGIKNVAVTAGYITEQARPDFYRYLDAVNIDLKGFTEDFYRKQCYAELQPVLDTLRWVHSETDVWLEVTTLLIPGLNDSDAELEQMSAWFSENLGAKVPWHFTAFHPDFKLTDRNRTPSTTLTRARDIARRAGMLYVYTGNVIDPDGQTTYCGNCKQIVIGRDGYHLGSWALDAAGRCTHCGQQLDGHFDPKPGNWGSRRSLLRVMRS